MTDGFYHKLRTAVAQGSLTGVKRLITRVGLPLRYPDPVNGWPLLFYAIRYQQNEIVQFFLEAGHDEKEISKDFANNSALLIAADYKNEEAFNMYVQQYPSVVSICNNDGKSALICATEKGMVGIVTALLDMGLDVNAADLTGSTPLHYAAAFGHLDIITQFMERGASYNVQNKRGWTPFDYAFSLETRDHLQECATAIAEKRPIKRGTVRSSGITKSISGSFAVPAKIDLRTLF